MGINKLYCSTCHSEGVKKLISSTFVPKGRVDFQSFRMRSLRLRVTCHGNKDVYLSGLTAQCFNFKRLRPKASPIHPSFRFDPCVQFFHTFSGTSSEVGFLLIQQTGEAYNESKRKKLNLIESGCIEKLRGI